MADYDNNNQANSNYNGNSYEINSNSTNNTENNTSYNSYSNSQESNGNTDAGNKMPEYSFYAEQFQANSKTPANYGYNSGINNGYYQSQAGNTAGGYQPQGNNQGSYQSQQSYTNYNNAPNDNGCYSYQYSNNNQYYNNNYANNPYGNNYNQYSNNGNRPDKKERKPKRFGKVLTFAVKAVCFGLIAGAGFFGFHKIYSVINPGASVKNVIDAVDNQNRYEIAYTKPASVTVSDESVVNKVVADNLPSIVSITSVIQENNWFGQSYDVPGSGSGIIVGKTEEEILVATNNHVVEGASKITVTFVDGEEADGVIKGTDVVADLAVVALDIDDIPDATFKKITVAKLGNSDEVKVGEMVIAIGNALGYGQSTTVGYISAKDREVEVSDGYFNTKKMVLLQTDAAINPGNSGGALLNIRGEVIGINSVKYATEEVEGMGFAIPISSAIPIINELMSREILSEEEQGFLGITGADVTEDASEAYNIPVGVFVNEVVEDGPAQKAGLQQGDIIIKVDEITITSISQLREYVNSKRVGTDVKVTYMRYNNGKYEENTVTVTLGKNQQLKK